MTTHTKEEYAARQAQIDRITPAMFQSYNRTQLDAGEEALKTYGGALPKALREAETTECPGLWYVYNMGFLCKSERCLFSLDISHPQSEVLADKLDFALITHNHGDHYFTSFYHRMNDDLHKTVVSNFADNYGAHFAQNEFSAGFTHGDKDFTS